MHRSSSHISAFLCCFIFVQVAVSEESSTDASEPVKVLVVTGGCCHDYDFQTLMLKSRVEERGIDVRWKVVNKGGTGTTARIDLYDDPQWANDFDVVIHNECFANTSDPEYVRKITKAHKEGANAVVIHCAMHTYRAAKIDDWREFLGVTSRRHEHQSQYPVKVVAKDHPIMKDFPADYTTPKDELYVIEHVWPETKILATSTSERTGKVHPVIWTSKYGNARVFGTTYGHSNDTFSDKVFLDTVIRGMLWAAQKLPE